MSVDAALITAADVLGYYRSHPLAGMPTTDGGVPAVTRVAFMTSKEAGALLAGESIGRPDGAPVCYVEFKGAFTVRVLAFGGGGAASSVVVATAAAVLDARSGNLLLSGTRS